MSANNLNDLLIEFQKNVGLVNQFVKGDATVTVVASEGEYPSLAKLVALNLLELNNTTSSGRDAINAFILDTQAEIAAVVLANQAVVANSQAEIAAAVATGQDAIAASNTAVTNVINASQAELDSIIQAGQAALLSIESLGQSNITELLNDARIALDASQAALVVSQTALANVLAEASGTISVVFKVPTPSLSWTIHHALGSRLFTLVIKDVNGNEIHENSVTINSDNEFVINFTDVEAGAVYVTFYLNV